MDPAKQHYRHPAEYYTDPENSIGYLARITFRSCSRLLERGTLSHGVSSGQWRFLRQLWREDGITQRELSRRVGMREPTTVIALKSLEKSGFVRREQSTEDRRRIHVFLTPLARRLEKKLMPAVAEVNAIATRGISARDVEKLRKLLAKVGANLAEDIPETKLASDSSV